MKKITIQKINEIREKRSLWGWTKIAIVIWLIWNLGIYILIGTGAMIAVPIMLIMDGQKKTEARQTWSGSITATELSEDGCRKLRSAQLKGAIKNGDEEKINDLQQLELWERTLRPEDESTIANVARRELKIYCEAWEMNLENFGIKENSTPWDELLYWSSQ